MNATQRAVLVVLSGYQRMQVTIKRRTFERTIPLRSLVFSNANSN